MNAAVHFNPNSPAAVNILLSAALSGDLKMFLVTQQHSSQSKVGGVTTAPCEETVGVRPF
jgi:hypothetical protein